MKNVKIFLLLLSTVLVISYEPIYNLDKRYNYYKNITSISNSLVKLNFDPNSGFFCQANDHLHKDQIIMKVPIEYSLSPLDFFPFKNELFKYLETSEFFRRNSDQISKQVNVLLSYYILYVHLADKELMEKYFKEKKMDHYLNSTKVNPKIFNSFVDIPLSSYSSSQEHIDLLSSMGIPMSGEQDLEQIHANVIAEAAKDEHFEILYPIISNLEMFKWAFGNLLNRATFIDNRLYTKVKGRPANINSQIEPQKVNTAINSKFIKSQMFPTLISYVDLCNYYQPKFFDKRDKKDLILDGEPGYYLYRLDSDYQPGEEISYTYTSGATSLDQFINYGFVIPYNIFNIINMQVIEDKTINSEQFKICREVDCIEANIKSHNEIQKTRLYYLNLNGLNEKLLNYAKIKYLNDTKEPTKIIKNILNNQPISYTNEMSAYLFYYKNSIETVNKVNRPILKILNRIQRFSDQIEKLEKNWEDNAENKKQWQRLVMFKIIYEMDFSFKVIIQKHISYLQNQIIKNAKTELDQLRASYLN